MKYADYNNNPYFNDTNTFYLAHTQTKKNIQILNRYYEYTLIGNSWFPTYFFVTAKFSRDANIRIVKLIITKGDYDIH